MRINSDDRLSYVEFIFQGSSSEDDLRIARRKDLDLSVEVSCDGFRGQNSSIWFGQDEIQGFLKEMKVLEKERKGIAQLVSLGYPTEHIELDLQVYSTDNMGHFALKCDLQEIRYSSRQE